MTRSLRRRLVVCLAALALLAAPTGAFASEGLDSIANKPAPAMFDVFVMRPMGLVMLGVSSVLFVPAAAFTAASRPSELGTTYEHMIQRPAQFVFSDPIGTH